jgi:hypothetical protein
VVRIAAMKKEAILTPSGRSRMFADPTLGALGGVVDPAAYQRHHRHTGLKA